MNRVTRDDTEHGVEYVRADEAQATFDKLNIALTAWHDKTDWVQTTAQPMELGMHRADVLKQRIDALNKAVADEREACAKVIDKMLTDTPIGSHPRTEALFFAARNIRARGNT